MRLKILPYDRKINYKLSSKEEKTINKMRIGHIKLLTHSYLTTRSDPSERFTCGIQLSIKYIFSK